jgi:ADP-heptose:LPS heptosyltransferase
MTPNQPTHQLFVPLWIRYEIAPFLHGKGACYGTQGTPICNPASKTKDFFTIYADNDRVLGNAVVDNQENFFRLFAKQTLDHIVLGPKATKDLASIKLAKDRLRPGGTLILFSDQPFMGSQMSSEGWHLMCNHPDFNPTLPAKSVAIIRYGAFGDLTMITPLLEQCHLAGEHVTLYTQPYAKAVLDNNPHIDRVLLQEKDCIALQELDKYFAYIKTKYGRFIDLCESIEGSMLKLESRREFYMPKEWRDKTCSENYYRKTLRLGGFDEASRQPIIRGKFYLSSSEKAWAENEFNKLSNDGRDWVWGWALHGTSHHKCYPLSQPLLYSYLADHPDERVVLLGDSGHVDLQFDHPQVIHRAGVYSVRQLIAILARLDGVVSPESFIANASAAWDKPTITLLSHSSRENLCSSWKYDYALEPVAEIAPCFPCHQLHYTPNSCPQREIIDTETNEVVVAGAACTIGAISMETLAERMTEVRAAFRPKNPRNPAAASTPGVEGRQ